MIDFEELLYGPLYDVFGVEALLVLAAGGTFTLCVIDGTAGAEVVAKRGRDHISPVQLFTTRPVVSVRFSELKAKSIAVSSLDGATITVNGGTWTVKDHARKPGPQGQESGEIQLILMGD